MNKKVLFISSGGGHLEELLMLKELFADCQPLLVTEKTATTSSLAAKYPTAYLKYGTKDHLLAYLFIFPWNILLSLIIFCRFRPDAVVTTGTHTAVPMCYIAHFFHKKVVWIETFANVNTPTKAGRLVYRIADKFIIQWPNLKKFYPNGEYWGAIF